MPEPIYHNVYIKANPSPVLAMLDAVVAMRRAGIPEPDVRAFVRRVAGSPDPEAMQIIRETVVVLDPYEEAGRDEQS